LYGEASGFVEDKDVRIFVDQERANIFLLLLRGGG
jgi:hypothetical protein